MKERLALIGSGAMGTYHARSIVNHLGDEAKLVQIIDSDIDRAIKLAADLGLSDKVEIGDYINLVQRDRVDGAIIANPSEHHTQTAIELINRGISVLIEKPVALTVNDAEAIDQAANRLQVSAMVGHIELFNPVIRGLDALIKGEEITSMRFKRLGAVADQTRLKHDVVQDLMLHDISIAEMMAGHRGSDTADVLLSYGRADTLASPDPAEAIVNFALFDAHFRASRAYSGGKVRSVEVATTTGLYVADLLLKTVVKNQASEGVIVPNGTYTQDISSSPHFISEARQPLTLEQLFFIQCIRGEVSPEDERVSIANAIKIMHLTDAILKQMVSLPS